MLDEEANIFKVPYLHGKHVRICGGYKCEGDCALPGEVCRAVLKEQDYSFREERGRLSRSQQKA